MYDVLHNWLGTPFVYGGNSHSGCDCAGLVIGVLEELQIFPHGHSLLRLRQQLPAGNLSDSSALLPQQLSELFTLSPTPYNGAIVLCRFQHRLFHVGFWWDNTIIHACLACHCVVQQTFDPPLQRCTLGYYTWDI